ncbi:GTPase Ylf2 [Schizosaccharomyces cryophilus OY26]|uniref:Obg-like ATPase homolog n=1 Tax=Schizosaccharomyces cryophilus (strain OY26 / ATCC MYA-4695 / CBS 11777 / NBRC 106824 / NRRL Y48691) TaxID=653667 RepID=S9XHW5_SCHCR|nr:GTPase Ylf2 [Schizosaccharomyces cryophilus OY26]EPY53271.1 GTPase Ylf2 [Schizosaccharomyces cryophilus OY26]
MNYFGTRIVLQNRCASARPKVLRSFSNCQAFLAKPEPSRRRLGRPGNHLKIGIVGMPNIGKSTLFQMLTRTTLGKPANYPFATIDPVSAKVPVPDPRYELLCDKMNPAKRIPAQLSIYDTAGLVRNASKGQGLGNAFLSNIRTVDAIFQLVRAFPEPDVTHVEETVDPIRDLQIIQEELLLKDAEFVESFLKKESRSSKVPAKAKEVAKKVLQCVLDNGCPVSKCSWSDEEVGFLNSFNLLTAKPVVYLVNMDEDDFLQKKKGPLQKVESWVEKFSPGDSVLPLSIIFEEQLFLLTPQELEEECSTLQVSSQLPSIIQAGYSALSLMHYFTAGNNIVQAWTVPLDTKAPDAAGAIHTDFKKKFVAGEITDFKDFLQYGTLEACKAAGKTIVKGKDYVVQPGDIIYWRIAR